MQPTPTAPWVTNGDRDAMRSLTALIERDPHVVAVTLHAKPFDGSEVTVSRIRLDEVMVVLGDGTVVDHPSAHDLGTAVCDRLASDSQAYFADHMPKSETGRPAWMAFRWRAWNGASEPVSTTEDARKGWSIRRHPLESPNHTTPAPNASEQAASMVVAMLGRLEGAYGGSVTVMESALRVVEGAYGRLIEQQQRALAIERQEAREYRERADQLVDQALMMRIEQAEEVEQRAETAGRSPAAEQAVQLLQQAIQVYAAQSGGADLGPLAPIVQHAGIRTALSSPKVQAMLAQPGAIDQLASMLTELAGDGAE